LTFHSTTKFIDWLVYYSFESPFASQKIRGLLTNRITLKHLLPKQRIYATEKNDLITPFFPTRRKSQLNFKKQNIAKGDFGNNNRLKISHTRYKVRTKK